MTTSDHEYTIGELAKLADTTPRTIRYYTAEGLLPTPATRGKYTVYTDEYVVRLELIALLKQARLPLSDIRSALEPLSYAQLTQLHDQLREPEETTQPAQVHASKMPDLSSAADYVAEVIGKPQNIRQQLAEAVEQYSVPPASEPRMPHAVALPASQASAARPDRLPASTREPVLPPSQQGFPQAEPATSSHWRRIILVDGIELHIREPQSLTAAKLLASLTAHFQHFFRSERAPGEEALITKGQQ